MKTSPQDFLGTHVAEIVIGGIIIMGVVVSMLQRYLVSR